MPTLKQILETKPKYRDESQNVTKKHGNASVQELLKTLKSREKYQTHQLQTQSKSIGDIIPNQKYGNEVPRPNQLLPNQKPKLI